MTGLLGLKALEGKRAILDNGKRMLHLPGDGVFDIVLPPGSVSYPLDKVPSGHLALAVDTYEKLNKKTGGVPDTSLDLLSSIHSSTSCQCWDQYCGRCGSQYLSTSREE